MPNLESLRHDLSRRFGGFELFTAGQQTAEDGGYTGIASGTSATRRLISTDLADLDLAGTASDTSSTAHDGAWDYIPATREQRRVVLNGYVTNVAADTVLTGGSASVRVGYHVLQRPLQAVVQPGTVWETHRWPVKDDDRKLGLHTAINNALGLLYVPDRLSITGLGYTTNRYTLAAYPWITSPDQLVATEDREVISGIDPLPLPGGADIRLDANTPYLITGSGVGTDYTFTIDVMRPRSTWIRRGGTWASSTVGLQDDTDECTGNANQIVPVAEYLICRGMEGHDPAGPRGNWAMRAARLAVAVGPWLRKDFVLVGQRAGGQRATVANVPGGLREVAARSSTSWP